MEDEPKQKTKGVRLSTVLIACAIHLLVGIHIGRGSLIHYNRILPFDFLSFPTKGMEESTDNNNIFLSDLMDSPTIIYPPVVKLSAETTVTDDNKNDNEKTTSVSSSPSDPPIFSLSLPNTGMSILPRYFQCAGLQEKFGRYWTHTNRGKIQRRPIGRCMSDNMKSFRPKKKKSSSILEGCGGYTIWHELQYREAPSYIATNPVGQSGKCFDPVLFPGALERLYKSAPNATIVIMIGDPTQWYKTLSYDVHMQWNEWCNPIHNNAFPTENTQEEYIAFYHRYYSLIRDFAQSHPGWNLIEVNMEEPNETTAKMLEVQFGINSQCWIDSVQGSIPVYNQNDGANPEVVINRLFRPNDITYPILTVSLPKSGTTTLDTYFQCNLGKWGSTHQWTKLTVNSRPPYNHTSIGDCMKNNVDVGQPILKDCGFARVYTDIGTIPSKPCYYAQLQGGLEKFAKDYPHATILLTVRKSDSWISSVRRWNHLDRRLSLSPGCGSVFPSPKASNQEWAAFYDNHVDFIRNFAQQHPTLTYIEVPLTDKAGVIMDDVFGFHKACWGHENANAGVKTAEQIKKPASGNIPSVRISAGPTQQQGRQDRRTSR